MACFYTPWEGADEAGSPTAFIKVELDAIDPPDLDRLLAAYRREAAGGATGGVVAWLAGHGVAAELVPLAPETGLPRF